MKSKALLAAAAAAVCLPATSAAIYSNNFEANKNGFTGAGQLARSYGLGSFGFGNQMLSNQSRGNPASASLLNLNLASQASNLVMTLDFAALGSWDGSVDYWGPDFFNIRVDGTSIFRSTFIWSTGAMVHPNISTIFYDPTNRAQAYAMSFNLGTLGAGAHTIEFFASGSGWQGGGDEYWAIDNILIGERSDTPQDVPEPLTGALMLAGLGALCVARRHQ